VREGDYFGEIALLDESIPGVPPNRRVATVRALQFSELQSVGKEHVKRVCDEFPEARDEPNLVHTLNYSVHLLCTVACVPG
jgi:CRP-like cAMP-binding protein